MSTLTRGPAASWSAGAPCSATWTGRPRRTGWRCRRGMCRTPASRGSRSAAGSAGSPAPSGSRSTAWSPPRWSPRAARWCCASADEHPELFWGLRGGGGNFGVVTRFEFRTHPLEGPLVGGLLHRSTAPDVLPATRDLMASAPDEMSVYEVLITAPAGPRSPRICGAAPPWRSGWRTAGRWRRACRRPPSSGAGPDPRPGGSDAVPRAPDDARRRRPARRHHRGRSEFLRELDDDVIDVLLDQFSRVTSPFAQVITARMGGAIARVADDATACEPPPGAAPAVDREPVDGGDPAPTWPGCGSCRKRSPRTARAPCT